MAVSRRVLIAVLPQLALSGPSAFAQPGRSLSVGLFVDIGDVNVPAGVNTVVTGGFHTPGKGAAAYVFTASQGQTPWRRRSRDGRWFQLVGDGGVSPEMFGAHGDGQGDDYPAFLALADFVNRGFARQVDLARSGRYLINQVMITGGPERNAVADIRFENCRDLRFNTNGARIRFKGDYPVTADYEQAAVFFCHRRHPSLVFAHCERCWFGPDYELDGQVNRSPGRDLQVNLGPDVRGAFQVGQTVTQGAARAVVKRIVARNPTSPNGGLVLAAVQGAVFGPANPNGLAIGGPLQSQTAAGVLESFLGVAERPSHGLYIAGCKDFFVGAGRIHHFPADGVMIAVGRVAAGVAPVSERVELRGVNSYANGRQSLTVAGAVDSRAVGCRFDRAGLTDGPYGAHRPAAGIDIEPDLTLASQPRTNRKTSFVFEDCTTNDCAGAPVLCSNVERTGAVVFRRHQARSPAARPMILSAETILIEDAVLENATLILEGASRARYGFTLRRSTLRSTDRECVPLLVETSDVVAEIEDNRFEFAQAGPASAGSPGLLRLISAESRFRRNQVFVDRSAWKAEGVDGSRRYGLALVFECREVSGNRFDTNLTSAFWRNAYNGATRVFDNVDVRGRWLRA